MEDDGVRSVNKGFQSRVVALFEDYILQCEIPVIHISGTVQERVKQIKEKINE